MQFGSLSYYKDLLFGNRDRMIASVGTIISLSSLVLSGILAWAPVPFFIVVRDLLVLSVLLLLFIGILAKFIRRERVIERLKMEIRQKDLFQEAQQLVQNYKKTLFYNYYDHSLEGDLYIFDDHDINVMDEICSFLTLSVRQSLIRHMQNRGIDIGDDLSVTVKLVLSSTEIIDTWNLSSDQESKVRTKDRWIITVYRDPHTHNKFLRVRETRSKFYDIGSNTAFEHVVSGDGNNYFAENDLASLPAYKNENPKWREYYNAAMVVPIGYRSEDIDGAPVTKCYGVLAADSLNLESLDLFDKDCLPIFSHAADLLATFFLTLELTEVFNAPSADP